MPTTETLSPLAPLPARPSAADRPVRRTPRPSIAFDLALANELLYSARELYALEHGDFGTREYRSAWLAFSRKIRTVDDLSAARAKAARRRSRRTPVGRPLYAANPLIPAR